MNYEGRIEVVFGPMFSGKSSELIRRVRRHQIAKKECLVLNYAKDTRYTDSDACCTHDKNMLKATRINLLSQVDSLVENQDVVAIDEGQFFDDLVYHAEKWANQGKIVIIAALDATFEMKPFGNICELLPLAESVKKLSAVCLDCGEKASFTKRVTNDKEIELIGHLDIYKPVCRKCFHKSIVTK